MTISDRDVAGILISEKNQLSQFSYSRQLLIFNLLLYVTLVISTSPLQAINSEQDTIITTTITEDSHSKKYFIQVNAFRNYLNALNQQIFLIETYKEKVIIKSEEKDNQIIYKVLVGPFDTLKEVEVVLFKTKIRGMIIKIYEPDKFK